jgi:hypothetical protein
MARQFLASALDGGKWSASRLCRFTPGIMTPNTHYVDPQTPQKYSPSTILSNHNEYFYLTILSQMVRSSEGDKKGRSVLLSGI